MGLSLPPLKLKSQKLANFLKTRGRGVASHILLKKKKNPRVKSYRLSGQRALPRDFLVTFVLHHFTWPPCTVHTLSDNNVTPAGAIRSPLEASCPQSAQLASFYSLCGKKVCGRPKRTRTLGSAQPTAASRGPLGEHATSRPPPF